MESLLRMRLDDGRERAFRAAQLIVEGDEARARGLIANIIQQAADGFAANLVQNIDFEASHVQKAPGARWRAEFGLPELHLVSIPSARWDNIVTDSVEVSRMVMETVQELMLAERDRDPTVSLNLVRFASASAESPTPEVCCGQHPSQLPYDQNASGPDAPLMLLLSRLRAPWVRPEDGASDPPIDLNAVEQKAGSLSLNPWRLNPWRLNPWRLNPWRLNPWRLNPWRLNWGSTMAIPVDAPVHATPANGSVDLGDDAPVVWIFDSGLGDSDVARPLEAWSWTEEEQVSEEIPRRSAEPIAGEDYHPAYLVADRITGDFFDRPDQRPDQRADGGDLGDGYIDVVAGHGTFIAGIYEQLTPGCRIFVRSVLGPDGDTSTWTLISALQKMAEWSAEQVRVNDEVPVDYLAKTIINLSLSGFEEESRSRDNGGPPPLLEEVIDELHAAGAVIVGSAGNEGTCEPTFPAAYANVVAVGALDELGPAPYSNHGPWVDLWAPGTDLVSAFLVCNGAMQSLIAADKASPEAVQARQDLFPHLSEELFDSMFDDTDDFTTQWAAWSGTSFAAPVVGAAIADAMIHATDPVDKTAKAALARVKQDAAPQTGSGDQRSVVTFGSDLIEIPADLPVDPG